MARPSVILPLQTAPARHIRSTLSGVRLQTALSLSCATASRASSATDRSGVEMMQSPRGQMPPPLSPRDLARAATLSPRDAHRPSSQRQMLEMAFEGESHPRSYGETGPARSPRSAYDARRPHSARLSSRDLSRSSGSSWQEMSTVLIPTTPSHELLHSVAYHIDDDTALLEQDDPELFRQGVLEHAQRLGINPRTQPELMWIARDSLVAQLPAGWVLQHASSTNSPYYYHIETGESQWDHPLDEYFRQRVEEYKRRNSYGGGSDRLSSSGGMHTASYYDQQGGYGDAAVAAAWEDEYGSAGGRLSYASSDFEHENGWRNDPASGVPTDYYQGYNEASTLATESSSKGYEEYSDLDVAESRSTLISSGRQTYVRGNGAASPSIAELEELKAQIEALERRNKELEDQHLQLNAKINDATPSSDLDALNAQIEELKNCNKQLEDQKNEGDELIMKLEGQVKTLTEQARNQSDDESRHLTEENQRLEAESQHIAAEKEKLESTIIELRAALDECSEELRQLRLTNESIQQDLVSFQESRSEEQESSATEEKLAMECEIKELRRLNAEEASKTTKLEEDLASQLERFTKVTNDYNEAQAIIKKLEGDLVRHAKREQDEEKDVAASAKALTLADDQIKSLTSQLEDVMNRLKISEAETESSRKEHDLLMADHARALEVRDAEYQRQLSSRDAELDAKEADLKAMKDSIHAAMEEKSALQEKLEQQAQLSAVLKAEADDQQRTLKRDLRVLERDLKALQTVSKEREDEFTAAKHVIADLEKKLHEQDAIVDAAKRSAREEAEKAASEIIRQVQSEKTRVAELYAQELQTRRKLHNRLMELQGNIRVFCRVRPIQAVELKSEQSSQAVYFRENDQETLDLAVGGELGSDGKLVNGAGQKHQFEFDHVFQPHSSQDEVFEQTKALVTSALDGFNVCIFAYGQTGSGKTHTMEGSDADPGLYYRSLEELFKIREERTVSGDYDCSMKLSMLEVYNETIVDLLDKAPPTSSLDQRKGLELRIGKHGVFAENLIEVEVYNETDVTDLMKLGKSHRSVGAHDFNEHSSRSHLVLSITIETFQKTENRRRVSKLQLIDLAGSERVSKTAASGQRLKEAQNINRSLSALGDVIAALGTGSKHVPFRNSKLTFLLQECLSGNSKVLMFVNVSPVQWNAQETLCSLNFASRCRNVALGMAKVNNSTSSETSSASPSVPRDLSRSINTANSNGGPKQKPTVPSPSVKGTQRVVFG